MVQVESSYAKPFLSIGEQVQLLRGRGMTTGAADEAGAILRRIGYYRLSGYWYPHRVRRTLDSGEVEVTSEFEANTSLRMVERIHDFDGQVRSLLLEAIEAVEIALRFRVGHTLGFRDRFAHREPASLDPAFTSSPAAGSSSRSAHAEWLEEYDRQEARSQETFVRHFRQEYGPHLPVWVATEVMSFGTLRRLLLGAAEQDRRLIAAAFDLFTSTGQGDSALLSNWLEHMRHLRNLCAHHARVWNRSFTAELARSRTVPELEHVDGRGRRHLYGSIAVLSYLLERIDPGGAWKARAMELIAGGQSRLGLSPEAMGFPDGWAGRAIWRADYRRDPELARRAQLLASAPVGTNDVTRQLLSVKPQRERQSWLRYLTKNSALVAVSYGGTKLYPRFQFRDGDVIPAVADLNEKLFRRLAGDTERAQVSWDVLEWWITPIPELGGAPKDLIGAGDLLESLGDEHLPGSHPVS